MKTLYVIQIPREDVEKLDISMATQTIKQLEKIGSQSQTIELTFSGYDETTDEVFEISAIRKWVTKLLKIAPEILYYSSLKIGTTTRLLACVYDMETVSEKRMNAHEVNEYMIENGSIPKQPVWISIPEKERMKIYSNLRNYGLKRKDLQGANKIVKTLKELFES
jgi:hypothetical protein